MDVKPSAKSILLIIAILMMAFSASLPARSDSDEDYYRSPARGSEVMPFDEVFSKLKAVIEGEIISVETEFEDGRRLYEVKFIDKLGYVREVYIDAHSGEIIAWGDD